MCTAATRAVDAATASSPLIVDAETHDDSKIAEFQEAFSTADLRLGVWVRATPASQQGTRLKPIVFRDLGAFIELPKTLATLSSVRLAYVIATILS